MPGLGRQFLARKAVLSWSTDLGFLMLERVRRTEAGLSKVTTRLTEPKKGFNLSIFLAHVFQNFVPKFHCSQSIKIWI